MTDNKLMRLQQAFTNMTSTLVSRAKTAALVGKQFGSDRDLYTALGYRRTINFSDYYQRYERGGIAARVISSLPQATWRNAPEVHEKGVRDEDSVFVKRFNEIAAKKKLFHYLERVDRIGGIGRYGALLIGIRASGQLRDPVRKRDTRPLDDLSYFSAYTEGSAGIKDFNTSATSTRFGLPEVYQIDLMGQLNTIGNRGQTPSKTVDIHASRVVHVAEGLDEDEVFGVPRLRTVWNYLDDLDKIVGSSAEAFWRVVDRGIQFDIAKDAELDDDDADDLADEIDEYMHGFKRYLRTRGVTANVLGTDTPDPRGAAETTLGLIAGTTGIPQRVLLGSERGQLASNNDERNFNSRARERQLLYAEPQILRPTIERLIAYGFLPDVEYEVEWPDLSTLTAREKADVSARMGQAAKNFEAAVGPFLGKGEVREVYFGLPRESSEELVSSSQEEGGEEPSEVDEDAADG